MLLVHGAGGSHLDWPAQLCQLPNVIALDLPGHYLSGGHKMALEQPEKVTQIIAEFVEQFAPIIKAGNSPA